MVRATLSASSVVRVASSILAKASLVGAKMVTGAIPSMVSWLMLAAVRAVTRVENLSSATSVATTGWDPVGFTLTGGRTLVGFLGV